MKQLSFLPCLKISTSLAHGGDIRAGKRKIARPFDPKRPLHIVLRSSRARGDWSMLKPKHRDAIEKLLNLLAAQNRVRIHRFANVGNHLHLLASFRDRRAMQAFLRRLAGEIAMKVTGARKLKSIGRFWDRLTYSRIVSQGREYKIVMKYLVKNLFEAAGLWDRKKNPHWEILSMPEGAG